MYELGYAARYRKPLRLLVPSTSGTVCNTNVTLASYLTYMYHLSLGGSFHVGSTQSHILISATLMRALRSPNTKQVSALTIMNKAKPCFVGLVDLGKKALLSFCLRRRYDEETSW